MKKQKKNNSVFDIFRLILCVLVVCIHTSFLSNILYPWLRLTVPLFFIMSSYFFFEKMNNIEETEQKRRILKRYVVRNLQLYAFWFVVLLPITLKLRDYFEDGVLTGMFNIIRAFLFSSTFRASWFIMALIIATVVVYCLSKFLSNKVMLVISFIIYLVVSIRSSYSFLYAGNEVVENFVLWYENIFTASFNSYPVAFLWIVCGKCFADGTFSWKSRKNNILMIVSLVALFCEWIIVRELSGNYNNDCYIMLFPASISIFYFVKMLPEVNNKKTPVLRKISTIVFACHASIQSVLSVLFDRFSITSDFTLFFSTVIVCSAVCVIILKFEKFKKFSFLKYSY